MYYIIFQNLQAKTNDKTKMKQRHHSDPRVIRLLVNPLAGTSFCFYMALHGPPALTFTSNYLRASHGSTRRKWREKKRRVQRERERERDEKAISISLLATR